MSAWQREWKWLRDNHPDYTLFLLAIGLCLVAAFVGALLAKWGWI
jgi:hypothetical protein